MKKEEIYVKIKSEEERLRVIEILKNSGEKIYEKSKLLREFDSELTAVFGLKEWGFSYSFNRQQITIDQLETLLKPNYVVKDVVLTLDGLKAQAERLGHLLVEKPYEPKIGDFGMFFDRDGTTHFDFLTKINEKDSLTPFGTSDDIWFENFRKLTEEEKQKIQEAW